METTSHTQQVDQAILNLNQLLVVTDKFGPHSGGTAVCWSEWCHCWQSEAVRVVTREFPEWQEFDRRQSYAVVRVPYLDIPKLRMPLVWLRLFVHAVQECRGGPAVLHCGQILETGCYAPWLKRRFGVPYVIHTYGEELSVYSRNPHLLGHMRRILANADGVTAISHNTERILRSVIGYTGPVLVVHPAVDTVRFVPGDGGDIRDRLKLGHGPLLLTVARLMPRKGIDRVLQALPSLLTRYPNLRYVIAGVGQDERRLRLLADEAGIAASVTFLGRVPEQDLVPLMQVADMFVHPNRELENGDVEGFGIVFLEAGACGVPVIGGRSGGAPEAIRDGVTGFLVDPESVDEIVRCATLLWEDDPLRKRMGCAGREWATRFSWDKGAAMIWEMSEEIANRTRPR